MASIFGCLHLFFLSKGFLGIQNNRKICGIHTLNKLIEHSISNVFVSCYIIEYFLEIFKAWKLGVEFFGG